MKLLIPAPNRIGHFSDILFTSLKSYNLNYSKTRFISNVSHCPKLMHLYGNVMLDFVSNGKLKIGDSIFTLSSVLQSERGTI